MEEITFKDWRLNASVDSDLLKLDIDARDGSDIIESGSGGATRAKDGEQYTLRFTTQKIEDAHNRSFRARHEDEDNDSDTDAIEEDEDETIYLRGWEVDAFVDEEGMLNIAAERGANADIYEVEPIESAVPLSSHVAIRLAADISLEDEDDEEEAEEDEEDEVDEFGEFDEYDEYDEEYDEEEYDDNYEEEEEEYSRYGSRFGRDDDLY